MNEHCQFLDIILHTKDFLTCFLRNYSNLFYLLLCLIIFCETGLIATPFLPGDSLLFTAGLLAKTNEGILNVWIILFLLIVSAILGDNLNYFVGRKVGIKIFEIKWLNKIIKREYLFRTEKFFELHGGKTIIMARFVPIVRTFAPFSAGMAKMSYKKYILFCLGGGIFWVCLLTFAGYFLGGNDWVQKNYEKVILGIIFVSILPVFLGLAKAKFGQRKKDSKIESE
jgi:membrane-associated protein